MANKYDRLMVAARAMQGMLASGHQEAIEAATIAAGGSATNGLAIAAIGFADALIAEVERTKPEDDPKA